MTYSESLVTHTLNREFINMITKLIIVKVNRDVTQQIISVKVQLLTENDKYLAETVIPISMFKDSKGIEVGKKVYLTCDY